MEYKTYKLGTCFSLIENGAIIKQRKEAKGFPITRIETLSHGKFNRDKLAMLTFSTQHLTNDIS